MSRKNQRRQDNRAIGRYVNRDNKNINSRDRLIDILNEECKNIGASRNKRMSRKLHPDVTACICKTHSKKNGKRYIRYIIQVAKQVITDEMFQNETRYTPAIVVIEDGKAFLVIKYGEEEKYKNAAKQGVEHGKIYLQMVPDDTFDSAGFLCAYDNFQNKLVWTWKSKPFRLDNAIAFPFDSAEYKEEEV